MQVVLLFGARSGGVCQRSLRLPLTGSPTACHMLATAPSSPTYTMASHRPHIHVHTYIHTYVHTHTHTAWPHTATPSSTCMRGIASAEPTLCPPVYSPRPHTYTQHHHPPRQSYKRTPADQHQHQHQHCHHHCCCTSVIHPSTSAHVFVHSDLVSQLTYVSGECNCRYQFTSTSFSRNQPNPNTNPNPNPTYMPPGEKR